MLIAPPTTGTITNTVTVDPANAIFEGDETNNVASYVTEVVTGIDLAVAKHDTVDLTPDVPPLVLEGFDPIATNGTQTYTIEVPVAKSVLDEAKVAASDIDLFVPHQANLRINQMVGAKLGIPEAKTVANIEKYGNTTAATIPLGLSEAWREGRCRRGSNVLMAAFGSGYTWGAAVLKL